MPLFRAQRHSQWGVEICFWSAPNGVHPTQFLHVDKGVENDGADLIRVLRSIRRCRRRMFRRRGVTVVASAMMPNPESWSVAIMSVDEQFRLEDAGFLEDEISPVLWVLTLFKLKLSDLKVGSTLQTAISGSTASPKLDCCSG